MTALSSTTTVFLKESKGAYLSVPSETADTDTQTAQDFPWTLALSSTGCDKKPTGLSRIHALMSSGTRAPFSFSFCLSPSWKPKDVSLFLLPYLSSSFPSENI